MNNNLMSVVLQMLGNGQNPNQIIQNAISQNPQVNAIFNQMRSSGMSMKDFTLQFAKQNNVNLQPVIAMLNQRGYKL